MAKKKNELVVEFSGATFMSAIILYLDLKHGDLPSIVFASVPAAFVLLYKLVNFLTVYFNFHSTDYYFLFAQRVGFGNPERHLGE